MRTAIGPDIALMAGANQQLPVGRAIRLGRELEKFGLAWFEPLCQGRLELRDSEAIVPEAAGWGLALDPAAIRRFKA